MDFSKYGYKHKANCESCEFYEYDEYTDSYCCTMNLDEDEMMHFLSGKNFNCPYYKNGVEYSIVRKQN